MSRGYFGIGIENTKNRINVGGLWRSAWNFHSSFIFTIGRRYRQQASDTVKAWKNIPLYRYLDFDEFYGQMPKDCRLVGVEFGEDARSIVNYCHPPRAIYLLGAEDNGLTDQALDRCHHIVEIPSRHCLNVHVAGSILMYDRMIKREFDR